MPIVSQAGELVVRILLEPEKAKNRVILLNTIKASQNEIIEALEKATGQEWQKTYSTTDGLIERGKELIPSNPRAGYLMIIHGVLFDESGKYHLVDDRSDAVEFGIHGLPVSEVVNGVVKEVVG